MCIGTAIWLAIILWAGVSLGRILWVCATDVLAFGREEQIISVTIEETDTLDDISQKLEEAGLITDHRIGRERRIRGDLEAIRRAQRLLDAYEDIWRARIDGLDALLAGD